MITPKVHITLPEHFDEDEYDEARHFAPILPLLKGVIEVNVWHIRRALRRAQKGLGYPIPPLYASGVRYKEDPPGQENWKDCLAVLADGHGDDQLSLLGLENGGQAGAAIAQLLHAVDRHLVFVGNIILPQPG